MKKNKITNPKIIKEIQRLCKENGGLLPPPKVIKAAEPVSSILHKKFEWNNAIAGHEYRLWQARQLLACVYINISPRTEKVQEVQAFVSLVTDRKNDGGYRSIIDVLSDSDLRNQLIRDALADMQIFTDRYQTLRELAIVFASIKKVKKKLKVA